MKLGQMNIDKRSKNKVLLHEQCPHCSHHRVIRNDGTNPTYHKKCLRCKKILE